MTGLRIRGLTDEDDAPTMRSPTSANPLQSRFNQINEILDQNMDEVSSNLFLVFTWTVLGCVALKLSDLTVLVSVAGGLFPV